MASKWKIPPIEKILEAYSAIVDDRIELHEDKAMVSSSDLKKVYTITWNNDTYTSNDNATYWQGYLGYPIIAVLMLQNKLSLNKDIAQYFYGINWKELNKKNKNDYSKVANILFEEMYKKGINCDKIKTELDHVYNQIKELEIVIKRSSLRPPK